MYIYLLSIRISTRFPLSPNPMSNPPSPGVVCGRSPSHAGVNFLSMLIQHVRNTSVSILSNVSKTCPKKCRSHKMKFSVSYVSRNVSQTSVYRVQRVQKCAKRI